MKVRARWGDSATASVELAKAMKDGAKLGGIFKAEIFDAQGNFVSETEGENIVTNQGLDHILNVILHETTAKATWYCCLVESDTAAAAGMTYAVPVYTESTAYDEETRPAYVEAAASSQSITNSANKAVFTISATKTIYGASLVSFATKGNTAESGAVLLCYAKFGASQAVQDDYVVNLTYTLSAADDGV